MVGPAGQGQVELARLEGHAVDAVDLLAGVLTGLGDHRDGLGHQPGVVEAHVTQRHMGADRLRLDAQPGGVAERAVGVGEGVEELVAGAGGGDLAGAGEDVHLEHRLVGQAAAEPWSRRCVTPSVRCRRCRVADGSTSSNGPPTKSSSISSPSIPPTSRRVERRMGGRCGSNRPLPASPPRWCCLRRNTSSPGRWRRKPTRRPHRRPWIGTGWMCCRATPRRRWPVTMGWCWWSARPVPARRACCAAAADDLRRQGRPLFGLAPTAQAARILERDTAIVADTVAKLVYEWDRPDRAPG